MADFESIVAPHRSARRLPFAEKYQAAVDWAEIQVRAELPKPDDIIRKIKSNKILTDKDKGVIIAALSKKPKAMGRPTTPPGRNFWIRRLVLSVAREFELKLTRGNCYSIECSAADAVADAMKRLKKSPGGFDRVRKLVAAARAEEASVAGRHLEQLDAKQTAMVAASRKLIEDFKDLGLG
jgi:hypothetical protein